MKRTQLNLDDKTYRLLTNYARLNDTSMSQAAREVLAQHLSHSLISKQNPLLGLAELGKKFQVKGPSNLSQKIDEYLYGELSPKFGKKTR